MIFSSKDGLLIEDGLLRKVSNENLDVHGSFNFPNKVTRIGFCAFLNCSNLKTCIIPAGVTAIHTNAFFNCRSLKRLIIPPKVTTIGMWVFGDCRSLESLIIPAEVATIGEGAFCGCHSLKNLIIKARVTTIHDYTFAHCRSLESLIIPAGVTAIDCRAFKGCSSLKTLTLPETLTSWGANVLEGCTQLENIVIASNDADHIARIKALLPADVQAKVTTLTLAQPAWDLKKQHLKEVERTALAPALYSFFNLDARTMYKKRGEQNQQIKFPTLPNDVLANINEYLGAHKNPYYQRAKEAMDQLPLPKNNAELVVYANQVKALADNEAEKAIMSQEKYDVHPR